MYTEFRQVAKAGRAANSSGTLEPPRGIRGCSTCDIACSGTGETVKKNTKPK